MLHPDAYRARLSAAQIAALAADAPALAAAERAARDAVCAALEARYDVSPLQADATGATWPPRLREAVVELALVPLLGRGLPPDAPGAAAQRQRAQAQQAWLALAAAGLADPGLPPRPLTDPATGGPTPLLGGSRPRIPHDRP